MISANGAMTRIMSNEIFELKNPSGDTFEKTSGDYKIMVLTSDFGFDKHLVVEVKDLRTNVTVSADFSDLKGFSGNSSQTLRMNYGNGSNFLMSCVVKDAANAGRPGYVN
jgi:hypothetical protein